MDLLPAIDIRNGRSVRLWRGDFSRETAYGNPLERATELLEGGARLLHVVDLDAAVGGTSVNGRLIGKIADVVTRYGAEIQVGGGIRDDGAVAEMLGAGATRVVIGTAALRDPEMVTHLAMCNPGRIVIGLDYRRAPATGGAHSLSIADMMLATEGWTSGGTVSMEDALAWFEGTGVAAVVVTDIRRDGTLGGPDREGLAAVVSQTEIPVVASGGVSSLEDLRALGELSAGERRLAGVIVGKALLEGAFSLADALEVCR